MVVWGHRTEMKAIPLDRVLTSPEPQTSALAGGCPVDKPAAPRGSGLRGSGGWGQTYLGGRAQKAC